MIRYYVTDGRRADVLNCAARAIRTGVDLIQVREKDLSGRELYELLSRIRNLAHGTKTRVLVNDRVDIAMSAGIDGVHLPASGLPAARVRPLVGLLGVSTHTIAEAVEAEKAQCDFIVFGPIYDSPGKTAIGLDPLRQVVSAVKTPVLAIGGITDDNTAEVLETGAAGIGGIRLFQMD